MGLLMQSGGYDKVHRGEGRVETKENEGTAKRVLDDR